MRGQDQKLGKAEFGEPHLENVKHEKRTARVLECERVQVEPIDLLWYLKDSCPLGDLMVRTLNLGMAWSFLEACFILFLRNLLRQLPEEWLGGWEVVAMRAIGKVATEFWPDYWPGTIRVSRVSAWALASKVGHSSSIAQLNRREKIKSKERRFIK